MSHYTDFYEPDPWGEDEFTTSCRRCGKSDLTWGHDGRKWHLVEADCSAHQCERVHPDTSNDFEVLK